MPRPTRLSCLLVLAVVSLAGCLDGPAPGAGTGARDGDDGGAPAADDAYRTLAEGRASPFGTPVFFVHASEAPYVAWWDQVQTACGRDGCPPAPQVSFATERVVALAFGERAERCSAVNVTSVRTDAASSRTTVVATTTRWDPAPDAGCVAEVVSPWTLLAIPARDTTVEVLLDGAAVPLASREGHAGSVVVQRPPTREELWVIQRGSALPESNASARMIESREALEAWWSEHAVACDDVAPCGEPPTGVDFATARVIAFVLGARGDSCAWASVKDASTDLEAGITRVVVGEYRHHLGDCEGKPSNPWQLVVIPKRATTVEFRHEPPQ